VSWRKDDQALGDSSYGVVRQVTSLTRRRVVSTVFVALAIGVLAGALVVAFHKPVSVPGGSLLWRLELLSYDWRLPRQRVVPGDIVIVAIDKESSDNFQKWPWPRSLHAELLDRISKAGARAIGLDIVFSEVSSDAEITDWREEPEPSPDDWELKEALETSGRVVLAALLQEQETDRGDMESAMTSAQFPYWLFEDAAAGVGIVNFSKDLDDAVRRMHLTFTYQDEREPSFALALLQVAAADASLAQEMDTASPHPYLPDNTILINYVGPARTFKTVPYYQALDPDLVPDEFFNDKIVLIGATDPLLQDIHLSPVEGPRGRDMAGVEIQANSLATLLGGKWTRPVPVWVTLLATMLFSVLAAIGTALLRPLRALLIVAIPVTGLGVAVPFILLRSYHIWVPMVAPLAALAISYTAVTVYMYVVEERARRAIRAAWQRRVAPEVLDVILKDPEFAYVHGRRTVATTLFSDIRGFTTMCDNLEPEEVVELLNEYLTEMTKVIRKHRGTIHKFIGDGIMAVFGDPIPDDGHADQAAAAALEMHRRLVEMGQSSDNPSIQQMQIGVGIHTGELVAGDIGSAEFMEYTVIGATVSVASRLETLNKEFGTGVIISEDTKKALEGEYDTEELGFQEIRGIAEPIRVHALVVQHSGKT